MPGQHGTHDPSCTDLNNAKAGSGRSSPTSTPASRTSGWQSFHRREHLEPVQRPEPSNYNSATAAYTIVPLSSDFRNPNGTLNTNSNLVSTLACVQGAGTTSYSNAIEAAQAELVAHGRANVPKMIVFFTDGAANTGSDVLLDVVALPHQAMPPRHHLGGRRQGHRNGRLLDRLCPGRRRPAVAVPSTRNRRVPGDHRPPGAHADRHRARTSSSSARARASCRRSTAPSRRTSRTARRA